MSQQSLLYNWYIDGTIDRFRATGNNKNSGRLRPTPDQAGTVLCIKE